MKTLYLIRHGQTQWNVQRRMQGRLDSPLTDVGRHQAGAHGSLLKSLGTVDRLIVSPSGRTRETAYLVNSHVAARLTYDESLMERDCGEWSGLTVDEIESSYPKAWQSRLDDPYYYRPPGGENHPDMLERVRGLLESLHEAHGETIGLITHGVMSRVILKHFLELQPREAVQVRHPNDLFYRLEFGPAEISPSHFQAGQGPRAGLLRNPADGTIARPE